MGLSFHDEASMVEVAGSLLRFTPEPDDDDPNSILETGMSGSISQGRRDDSITESVDRGAGSDVIQSPGMSGSISQGRRDDSITESVDRGAGSDDIQSPDHGRERRNLWRNTAYTNSEIRGT